MQVLFKLRLGEGAKNPKQQQQQNQTNNQEKTTKNKTTTTKKKKKTPKTGENVAFPEPEIKSDHINHK